MKHKQGVIASIHTSRATGRTMLDSALLKALHRKYLTLDHDIRPTTDRLAFDIA
jgi:hypothetical protein